MILQFKRPEEPFVGLHPHPIPADLFPPTHLTCGGCGYHGPVRFWYDNGVDFEPMCNCPVAATLEA